MYNEKLIKVANECSGVCTYLLSMCRLIFKKVRLSIQKGKQVSPQLVWGQCIHCVMPSLPLLHLILYIYMWAHSGSDVIKCHERHLGPPSLGIICVSFQFSADIVTDDAINVVSDEERTPGGNFPLVWFYGSDSHPRCGIVKAFITK